ncbi:unnamed protein product [Coregonus sp. 'balchen']|nr:unnamed protein product [Coregonus sp. 'balchen']
MTDGITANKTNTVNRNTPWKGEIAALIEKDKQSLPSHRAATMKHDPNQKYEWNMYGQQENREQGKQYVSDGREHPAEYKEVLPVPDHTLANQEEQSNRFTSNTDYLQIIRDRTKQKHYSGTFMDEYGTGDQY